ncbi:MAG: 16S rRNA (uracil(1498)-N(3))-methyltransferase [Pirellulaceae bacterium]|nr:16S rRNA (uracil(1498)-N(3))-methyltransferase [Pirellulaceae bacterium]
MSRCRFYVPELPQCGNVLLSAEDSRHAATVLRLRPGDHVELFDGQGLVAQASIVHSSKSSVSVEIATTMTEAIEHSGGLDLLVSLPKGDRQKALIDMLVQLDVRSLIPLECQRSVAQPTSQVIERLRRAVIEASKQCCRNYLMKVQPAVSLTALLASPQATVAASAPSPCRWFAHPYGVSQPLVDMLDGFREQKAPGTAQVIVGPEGGLSNEECSALRAVGWQQINLGRRILRIETAAIKIAAVWAAWNGATSDPSRLGQ